MTAERTPSESLSPLERAREVADIVAMAIARANSTRQKESEVSLAIVPAKSVHTNPSQQGVL